MKKKIMALLIVLACIPVTAFAENTAEVSNRNGVISVTGKTSPDTIVSLTVKSSDDNSGLYAIKETFSDSEGNYNFNFTLRKRQTEQDIYKYVLSINGDGEYSENITVFSENAIDNFAGDIKTGKLKELIEDETKVELAKSFSLDIAGYNAVKNSGDVTGAFYSDIDIENATNDEIADVFNTEILLFKSLSADETEFYSLLKDDFDEREISDFTKKRLYETKDYGSIKEYEYQILMFEALSEVNNAKYSQLEKIFEEKEELLTLDSCDEYDTYKGMSSSKKRTVNEGVVSTLLKNPAQSTDDFINVFEDKVKETDKKSSNSSSGGGDSSSPGGKGSSKSSSSVVMYDTSENIVPEKKKIFADVELDFWAEDNIRTLAENGIINGYEDGTFRPGNTITREEFVTILVNAFKLKKSSAECEFDDVEKDKWFYTYVASAYTAGAVGGVSETEFGTGKNVTRQDVAVMIARVMKLTGNAAGGDFADDAEIADYAKASVYELKKLGVINGKDNNKFDPYGECTRAECATMIKKAMDI